MMDDVERIGRYRIENRLGSGSFATVYKGHDDGLDVPVAIKILADNWANNEDVRNRFLREARLMRQINDERICRVYDIGTLEDSRPYFVMDFANAGSLEDLRKRLVEPGRALRLCAEAARALEVLHRNSVIHRDVTPGNILLSTSPDGATHILLADLGVAKSMIGESGATMTAGTPAYMALEQATGVGTLDQRADIYSIAAVTYALLTGRPPFPVKTLADLLSRNPNIAPAPVAAEIGAPPELDTLLQAALSPVPQQRPQSALDFATSLDTFADGLPGAASYTPRPLAASEGTVLRPTGGNPSGGISRQSSPPMANSFNASIYSSLTTAMSAQVAPTTTLPPVAPRSGSTSIYETPPSIYETPPSILTSYLGPPAVPFEPPSANHSLTFWAWVIVAALTLFVLALVFTVLLAG